VVALSTTRAGGFSSGPYRALNLAHHVGDQPSLVDANRALLSGFLPAGTRVCWLNQVHGVKVVKAGCVDATIVRSADASWTDQPGVACAVMTADCLPVLFCDVDGSCVAAAHAGWRGLQAGVLEATVAAMGIDPGRLMAWLGPAIGPARFEVGGEVREAFLAAAELAERAAVQSCFLPSAGHDGHFFADLYALARCRLRVAHVAGIYGGGYCTYDEDRRFFSYRRDRTTGRMATLIALGPELEKR
jgi:YfiH family protein